jgi:hypothetical protein
MTFEGASKDPMQQTVRDATGRHEHAKASGARYKGRKPSFSREQLDAVQDMLGVEAGVSARIKDDAAWSEAALATWGQ